MAIFLGVDTGGTYTDAVLIEGDAVLAKAKALTTRADLAVGIGAAVDRVLGDSGIAAGAIALVSLSTTLATNALVEGHGGRVALVSVGFSGADMQRQGLAAALQGDPLIHVAGGHSHSGGEAASLDLAALEAGLETHGSEVGAFAVVAQFATRNPAHEIAVRDAIRARLDKPVTCSHELSAQLGGPKRALTALLNARLISLISHLIDASTQLLGARGITAPLMVVRGDGALIAAEMARDRPIETILSGPAASLVGARWLTGARTALVSDIGGTTTDVAYLRNGRPGIDALGAKVGHHNTMVEAVAVRTVGLGGDSEVRLLTEGLTSAITLGPRRLVPLALAAMDWPDLVHRALDDQLASDRTGERDGQFVVPVLHADRNLSGLGPREMALIERLGDSAAVRAVLVRNRMESAALQTLAGRGLVQICGLTPSDAAHVLGRQQGWDGSAARKGAALFARLRTGTGVPFATSPDQVAERIVAALTQQTAQVLMIAAFSEDGFEAAEALARHPLVFSAQGGHVGLVRLDVGLAVPVIGLGASAASYYPAVGDRLGCEMILPEHADVANAIGAVVGQISVHAEMVVTAPQDAVFRVHLGVGPMDYADLEAALARAAKAATAAAEQLALDAGSAAPRVTLSQKVRMVEIEGREKFIEATVRAEATGRPRVAEG